MPQPSPQAIERELCFWPDDLALFAAASGDRSPLHMDPAFARRTSFGGRIVHGGLLSMGMLGLLPAAALANVRSVRSTFPGPVLPGDVCAARAQAHPARPDQWEVWLSARGKVVARLVASTGDREPAGVDRASMLDRAAGQGAAGPAEAITGEYRTGAELLELVRRFGLESLDRAVLEGIAWASNVVGMTIPDFDGLCAAVTIVAAGHPAVDSPAARQWVRLRDHDERTDRMLVEGVLADDAGAPRCLGLIECFPFSPTPLPESAALTSEGPVEPEQGAVVVVGGSRGAGAVLALALLARGHVVHVIYSSSSDCAAELRRLAGPYATRLVLHRTDAGDRTAVAELGDAIAGTIDGLALCAAAPPLPMGFTAESTAELARYVGRSIDLAAVPLATFLPRLRREAGWVVLFSAAAVMEPRRELPQFTAAKAALEGLARWVSVTTPSARIVVARPPRMRTDLVNTPSGRLAATAPEAVVEAVLQQVDGAGPPGRVSIVEFGRTQVSV
ncbi:MAG: SDR family NAD(P)-dependent oxidoreductase [Actinomycetota bacterium]|nr:SDR family NAD(P)-dependent oxidoreductase [Actinomycetota bacterium]